MITKYMATLIVLQVAWPAGNSGIVAFWRPRNGVNGTLGIKLENTTTSGALGPVYEANSTGGNARVGISGSITFNATSELTVAILGSIRTIRDFTEGPSILVPRIQNAITYSRPNGACSFRLTRTWLDNVTTTELTFRNPEGNCSSGVVTLNQNNNTLYFSRGTFEFNATFNYPQLQQLNQTAVLNPTSQGLLQQSSDQTKSLSFLSYTDKLLAGAWRFLTYFGRDSMISALLLQPVLSEGEGSAIEAVIAAVLERVNISDGSVAHEETIGDYATYLSEQMNKTSTAPQYDYKMIDSDYYLPILMQNYFINSTIGRQRASTFYNKKQATLQPGATSYFSYQQVALIVFEAIVRRSSAFAANQTKENLMHLKDGQIVGEWRDSTYGIGGGRIPYDVNTALVPAALRSISALYATGLFDNTSAFDGIQDPAPAAQYAKVWEDNTLQFFQVNVSAAAARSSVSSYASSLGVPSYSDNITSDITYHGLALDGNNNQAIVQVMNTDDCFRLFFLNTTNQAQLSSFLNQTANNILAPFPVGLSNPVGLLVANPAYGMDPIYAANWTNNAYHGTVVWSWQLAMMAKGLERQLGRCSGPTHPDFCGYSGVADNVKKAYNHLWDLIEANSDLTSQEVWSWVYENGTYRSIPLGSLPPPAGQSPTESDIRQLWSLTFLAVRRDLSLK